MVLPQKLCGSRLSQKLPASIVYTLTCADCPPQSPRTKVASAEPEAEASQAGRTPVLWPGRWTDVWSPKTALPQKLCSSCMSQKLLALYSTLSPVQTALRGVPEPRWPINILISAFPFIFVK